MERIIAPERLREFDRVLEMCGGHHLTPPILVEGNVLMQFDPGDAQQFEAAWRSHGNRPLPLSNCGELAASPSGWESMFRRFKWALMG